MKVAVCLCGQFRTAKQCKDNILEVFTKDRPKDIEVDFFAHTWDYNGYLIEGSGAPNQLKTSTVSEELEEYFHPKKYVVEEMPEKFKSHDSDGWRLGQFYTESKSLKLRREYEEETGVEYDYVFFCRFDQLRFYWESKEYVEQGCLDHVVDWENLPEKTEVPTIYEWFTKFGWETWGGRPGFWILHDFSWFCNRPAANRLENLYDMYEELCRIFRSGKYQSPFWTNNILFDVPEKFLGLFCYLNDIYIEEDTSVYCPGLIVRESLRGMDMNSIPGRELLVRVVNRYGFGYTPKDVKKELKRIKDEESNSI